jgi:leader peptidase (prepilin peptidase) / N-methyltransferase
VSLIYPAMDHWFWLITAGVLGACIGSFLNVVIYRLPLGISISKPSRSFCPICHNQLTFWQNIPLLSWLCLKGKCAQCSAPIPFRYLFVEIVVGILFMLVWLIFPLQVVLILWVMMALLVAITWIDAEHLIIPTRLTWGGSIVGLIGCAVWPCLSHLTDSQDTWLQGVTSSAIGWAAGFFGIWIVVELGKKAFGKKILKYDKDVSWYLRESQNDHEPMHFVIDGVEIPWWDIFSRKTDRLIIDSTEVLVDGNLSSSGQLILKEDSITLADGKVCKIENLVSLSGLARGAILPREAMGMGDAHLIGMLGAFLGWTGVCFTIFAASLIALAAAIAGRIGFGRQLPFGPFLCLAGIIWLFGGWRIWQWYVQLLGF